MDRKTFQIVLRLSRGTASIWELIEAVDGTIVDTYRSCTDLLEREEAEFRSGRFSLTDAGRKAYGRYLRDGFQEVLARYRELITDVPRARVEFFQQRITPEDLFRRLEFMYRRGDLAARKIAPALYNLARDRMLGPHTAVLTKRQSHRGRGESSCQRGPRGQAATGKRRETPVRGSWVCPCPS